VHRVTPRRRERAHRNARETTRLGQIHLRADDAEAAIPYLKEGADVRRELGHPALWNALEGLGVGQYYSTHTSRRDPRWILAGSQDQGYQRGDTQGESDSLRHPRSSDW